MEPFHPASRSPLSVAESAGTSRIRCPHAESTEYPNAAVHPYLSLPQPALSVWSSEAAAPSSFDALDGHGQTLPPRIPVASPPASESYTCYPARRSVTHSPFPYPSDSPFLDGSLSSALPYGGPSSYIPPAIVGRSSTAVQPSSATALDTASRSHVATENQIACSSVGTLSSAPERRTFGFSPSFAAPSSTLGTSYLSQPVFSLPPPEPDRYPGPSAVFPAYSLSSSGAAPGNRFFSLLAAPIRLLSKLQQGALRRLGLRIPPPPAGFSPFLPPLLDQSSHRGDGEDLENPASLRYHSGATYASLASSTRTRRRCAHPRDGSAGFSATETQTGNAADTATQLSAHASSSAQKRAASSAFASAAAAPLGSWDAVADLDKFLYGVYRYWMEGGLFAILSAHLAHLTALAFTIYFSWFLILFVNWTGIVSCTTEEQCRAVPLLIASPFSPWGYKQTLCTVYVVSLSAFLLFNIAVSYLNCRDAVLIRTYFRSRLFIPSDAALQLLDWPEVTALLLKAQEAAPFCIVTNELSALDIVSTIMREENYFIALTNKNILTQKLPSWLPPKLLYTQVMQWNIRRAIFSRLFDRRQRIHRDLFTHPPHDELSPYQSAAAAALASRFKLLALLNLVFLVPLFLFIFFFFFLKHAEDFRLNRQSIVRREFNGYAYWVFREFNELPHQINQRLSLAAAAADEYLQLSPVSPSVFHIRLLVKYLIGSLLSIFILLYLFDETPLLFIKIFDRNLLWYTIILGVLYAGIRDVGSTGKPDAAGARGASGLGSDTVLAGSGCCRAVNAPLTLYERCMRVVQFTHHLPACWRAPAGLFAIPPPVALTSGGATAPGDLKKVAADSGRAAFPRSPAEAPVAQSAFASAPSSLSLLPPVPPRHAWLPPAHARTAGLGARLAQSASIFGGEEADDEVHPRVTGVSSQHKVVMRSFCSAFYGLRIVCLVEELLAVLLTPLLLWGFLPRVCDDICAFLFAATASSPFGDMCCFSSLNLEKFGSPCYLPAARDAAPLRKPQGGERARQARRGLRGDDGEEGLAARGPRMWCEGETGEQGKPGGDSGRRDSSPSPERGARGLSASHQSFRLAPVSSSWPGEGDSGGRDGAPSAGLLRANSGKIEKSALTFVLTYRIPPPYDDTSPLWTVFASDSLASSMAIVASQLRGSAPLPPAVADSFTLRRRPSAAAGSLSSSSTSSQAAERDRSDAALSSHVACPLVRWGYPESVVRFVRRLETFQREQIEKLPYLSHELPPYLLAPLNAFPGEAETRQRDAEAGARASRKSRGCTGRNLHRGTDTETDGESAGGEHETHAAREPARRGRSLRRRRARRRAQRRKGDDPMEDTSFSSESTLEESEEGRGASDGSDADTPRAWRGKHARAPRCRHCGHAGDLEATTEGERAEDTLSPSLSPSKKRKRRSSKDDSSETKAERSVDESFLADGGTGEGVLRAQGARGGGTGEEDGLPSCTAALNTKREGKRRRAQSPSSREGEDDRRHRGRREPKRPHARRSRRGHKGGRHIAPHDSSSSADGDARSPSPPASSPASPNATVDVCGPPPVPFERQASYFFWLERLYEQQSGRILFATNQLNFFTRCLFRQRFPCTHTHDAPHAPREERGAGSCGTHHSRSLYARPRRGGGEQPSHEEREEEEATSGRAKPEEGSEPMARPLAGGERSRDALGDGRARDEETDTRRREAVRPLARGSGSTVDAQEETGFQRHVQPLCETTGWAAASPAASPVSSPVASRGRGGSGEFDASQRLPASLMSSLAGGCVASPFSAAACCGRPEDGAARGRRKGAEEVSHDSRGESDLMPSMWLPPSVSTLLSEARPGFLVASREQRLSAGLGLYPAPDADGERDAARLQSVASPAACAPRPAAPEERGGSGVRLFEGADRAVSEDRQHTREKDLFSLDSMEGHDDEVEVFPGGSMM
ncbi:autophagy protein apg9 protein [Besnoitia besnoiti]|uniref:Autophagy-related protein 9 n=1 Tax=Besnoitia besnoiti TaxID=94643 RepID=A0A2A9MD59_BESBE|nr:autophagy protein apg9 protein [Besnoitia besnoiti]PFH33312.1 autophagy protein apg9 protein [Besnoitia besnoiti]